MPIKNERSRPHDAAVIFVAKLKSAEIWPPPWCPENTKTTNGFIVVSFFFASLIAIIADNNDYCRARSFQAQLSIDLSFLSIYQRCTRFIVLLLKHTNINFHTRTTLLLFLSLFVDHSRVLVIFFHSDFHDDLASSSLSILGSSLKNRRFGFLFFNDHSFTSSIIVAPITLTEYI